MLKYLILLPFLFGITEAKRLSDDEDKKKNKAIYGKDNRMDMHQTNDRLRSWGKGIAARVDLMIPFFEGDEFSMELPKLKKELKVCEDERFSSQPVIPHPCTGFLVAPNLLLTAGHCVMERRGEIKNVQTRLCEEKDWVFDYNYNTKEKDPLRGKTSSIVNCEKVIYGVNGVDRKDYALIKLSNNLIDRHIFKVTNEEIYDGKRIIIFGHPAGLPLKYAGDAFVTKPNPDKNYFEGTLDAVGGNSGSPVLNRKGQLFGILVRGNDDFITDDKKKCKRWNNCTRDGANCDDGKQDEGYDAGMHVQKIDAHLLKLIKDNS